MNTDDEGALQVRAELDQLASAAPPVGFTSADVLGRGRRARRTRRTSVALSAVAVAAVAIAVPAVAANSLSSGGGGSAPAAAAPSPTEPESTTGAATPGGTVAGPGLTDEQTRAITAGCVRAFGGTKVVRDARLYNFVRDSTGAHALLYGTGTMLSCSIGEDTMNYNPGGAYGADREFYRYLPGPISIDDLSRASGGKRHQSSKVDSPGYQVVAGRVTSDVQQVTVIVDGTRVQARPINGTYLIRISRPVSWRPPERISATVIAHLSTGKDVTVRYGTEPCTVSPNGTVISGNARKPTPACKPATLWR